MYYLGSISGASGAAYNWSGGVSGFAGFSVPLGAKALYLEGSASGLRFALSAATGYTGFLGTGGAVGSVQLAGPATLQGPFYRTPGANCMVGIYTSTATQYSVKVFGAHTP